MYYLFIDIYIYIYIYIYISNQAVVPSDRAVPDLLGALRRRHSEATPGLHNKIPP